MYYNHGTQKKLNNIRKHNSTLLCIQHTAICANTFNVKVIKIWQSINHE